MACYFRLTTASKLTNVTSIVCFDNPKKLILFGKNIQRIEPGALYNCKSVEKIYLYENELRELSRETFSSNIETTELSLGYNHLQFLDLDLFASLEKLEILDLMCNELVYFPAELVRNLDSLKEIQLASNRLLDLDIGPLLMYTPRLMWFYFNVNSIGCTRAEEIAKVILSRRVKVGVYFCPENQRAEHIEKAINSTVRIECMPDDVAREEAKGVKLLIEEWKKNRALFKSDRHTIINIETVTEQIELFDNETSSEVIPLSAFQALQDEFHNFTSKINQRFEFLLDQIIEIKQALKDGNKSIQVTLKQCETEADKDEKKRPETLT